MICIMSLFILSGCKKQELYTKTYFEYFDTVITISGYEKEKDDFVNNVEEIEKMLSEYHKLYDIYYEYSKMNNLCTINKKAYLEELVVDSKIIELIEYGKNMYELTNGMMNIAMGSVLRLWHNERTNASDYPEFAKIPDINDLEEASKYTNINDIVINKEKSTIFIKNEYTKIDVGGIAKGYVCEQIGKYLTDKGVSSYILNLGGNIKLIGSKPKNKPWTVGIQDPTNMNEQALILEVEDVSVVTSGSYQRYYLVDGIRYHHIINPNTLMPENDYLSVSIISKDSALCDTLSTALFNMSIEDGKKIISNIEDTYVLWIKIDESFEYSDGFCEKFLKGGIYA